MNILSNYYGSGAALGTTAHAQLLMSGPLGDLIRQRSTLDVIPPWILSQYTPTDETTTRGKAFASGPLVNPNDATFDKEGVPETTKKLFAAYQALERLNALVDYAGTKQGLTQLTSLEKRFEGWAGEIRSYIDGNKFDNLMLLAGIESASIKSSIARLRADPVDLALGLPIQSVYVGNRVSSVRADPIPRVTGTETFTMSVTKNGATTDLTVDLSLAASTKIDDVAAYMSDVLEDAGFGARVQVERKKEDFYALEVVTVKGEVLSFSNPSDASSAVYLAGRTSGGDFANGIVTKYDDLGAADPTQVFYNNIFTQQADGARKVKVDSEGYVYTIGTTKGAMDNQVSTGATDVFLNKYDPAGRLVSTRMLGSARDAGAYGLAIDGDDNVIITGQVYGPLTNLASTTNTGAADSFVMKFDASGKELWTRQVAPYGADGGQALTVDGDGNIFVAGFTYGAMAGQVSAGGKDAYLTKLSASGALVYNQQFGTAATDTADAIALDSSGLIFVAGMSGTSGYLRSFDDSGGTPTQLSNVDLGAIGADGAVTGIAVNSNDEVYVSGFTSNAALAGTVVNAHSGALDGFVIKLSGNNDLQAGTPLSANTSLNITVGAVNDGPTITAPGTQAVTDHSTNHVLSGLSIADVDAAAGQVEVILSTSGAGPNGLLTLSQFTGLTFTSGDGTQDTSMTFRGTVTNVNAALNDMLYRGQGYGSEALSISVSDLANTGSGGAQVSNASVTMNVGNQAPVVTVDGSITTRQNFSTAFTGISITDDAPGGQIFRVSNLSVANGTMTLGQTTGLTFTTGSGVGNAVMDFTGTLDDINAALSTVVYTPPNGFSGNSTLSLTVTDQQSASPGGAGTFSDTYGIQVFAGANDAPVITVPGAQSVDEDDSIAIAGISVADPDVGGATMRVTLSAGSGVLSLSQVTGLTFNTGDGSADGTMIFTGTQSAINSALNNLVYAPNADVTGSDTITVTVNDLTNTGSGAAQSDTDSITVNIGPMNDGPSITLPGQAQTAQNTDVTVSGLTFGDIDVDTGTVEVTLTASSGTFDLAQITGLTFSTGTGAGDGSMVFEGTLADVNAAVASLTFHPVNGFTGQVELDVTVDDLGNTGTGGTLSATDTILLSIPDDTNTAPVINSPGNQSASEDTDLTISGLSLTDIDSGSGDVEVTLSVANGVLTLGAFDGLSFTSGDGTQDSSMTFRGTAMEINKALEALVYRGNANFSGADALNITVNDLGQSEATPSGAGAVAWVTYSGTAADDRVHDLVIDTANGDDIYVAGETEGGFAGQTDFAAPVDGFFARLSDAGVAEDVTQFGGSSNHRAFGIALDNAGSSILSRLGLPEGDLFAQDSRTIVSQTTARAGQYFFVEVNGRRSRVTLEANDLWSSLATRINRAIGTAGKAQVQKSGSLESLVITAKNGGDIKLIAGPEGFDALPGLGLRATRLLAAVPKSGDDDADARAKAARFALGFTENMTLTTEKGRTDAKILVDNALKEIRDAHRYTEVGYEPPKKTVGAAPPDIAAKIAQYKDALQRISALAPQSSGGGLLG